MDFETLEKANELMGRLENADARHNWLERMRNMIDDAWESSSGLQFDMCGPVTLERAIHFTCEYIPKEQYLRVLDRMMEAIEVEHRAVYDELSAL
jgi:hypothetical protein